MGGTRSTHWRGEKYSTCRIFVGKTEGKNIQSGMVWAACIWVGIGIISLLLRPTGSIKGGELLY
jgi:hypothetical protein